MLCSMMLLDAHCKSQASWESVSAQDSMSSERASRAQVISSLAQIALTDEHAAAVAGLAMPMARLTGQVHSGPRLEAFTRFHSV